MRFVTIPPELARRLQRDSPFAEVIALNAAARRARGAFIGRIDQDTLVGRRFLGTFFDLIESRESLAVDVTRALLYANRRDLPFRFAVQSPPLDEVEAVVAWLGSRLPIPRRAGRPFWTYWVGIWLAHRDLWSEYGGYDERMLYYNWMEVDMILRMRTRHPLVDLGPRTDFDFYHLEHVHPLDRGRRHPVKNTPLNWTVTPKDYCPSGVEWGLASEALEISAGTRGIQSCRRSRVAGLRAAARVVWSGGAMAMDAVVLAGRNWHRDAQMWQGRARRAVDVMCANPLPSWPRVLATLWTSRGTKGRSHP